MNDEQFGRLAAGFGVSISRRVLGVVMGGALTALGFELADAKKKKKKKKKPPATCTPNCDGKQCGTNGCGGSCGSCSGEQTCNGLGQCACVPEPLSTTCADTCGSVENNCGTAVDCGPCEGFVFEREWGIFGSGNSQFVDPKGIAVDAAGNVYVADTDNDRIQKFDNDGAFLLKWGGNGTTDGKFRGPRGIAVDASGDIHVADTLNGRIQKFTNSGGYLTQWNSDGSPETVFENPSAIATDTAGNVYVSTRTDDSDFMGIRKFTSTGVFIARLDDDPNTFKTYDGLAIDSGTVYATYFIAGGDRIEKLSATTGALLGSIGSSGTNEGELGAPKGIALDAAGNLFVADWGNHRVQIFDPSGAVIDVIGQFGTGAGQFNLPVGVAVDGDGNLFVLDQRNERVQKFRPAGAARRTAAASKQTMEGGTRRHNRRRRNARRKQ